MDKVVNLIMKMDEKELRRCLRQSYFQSDLIQFRGLFRSRLQEKGVEPRLIERMENDLKRAELAKVA